MRASGILMPVFSLPGPFGIGTLGKEAFAFVDFLADAKQTYWQILPIGPTGYGDSPYPVSYTHLDVYKRQDLYREFAELSAHFDLRAIQSAQKQLRMLCNFHENTFGLLIFYAYYAIL